MPTLRWEDDSLFSDLPRSGQMVRPGQELDVDEDDVDAYLDHRSDGWVLVDDEDDAAETDSSTGESSTAEDDEDLAEDEDEPEIAFDVEGFLDRNVDPVSDDIKNGVADGYLEDVEEGADRKTVLDAIESRREELEAEG